MKKKLNIKYVLLNDSTPVSEIWMGTLLPDSSVVYTFATSFVIPFSQFSLCTWTQLSNDGISFNDSLCTSIDIISIQYDAGVTEITTP